MAKILEDSVEEEQVPWREQFDSNKIEVNFFENTLDIRKNAIETYIDYKMEDFKNKEESASEDEEDTITDPSGSEEEETESESDDETVVLVTSCPKCNSKLYRNHKTEKIIKQFDKMMHYRNLIEN